MRGKRVRVVLYYITRIIIIIITVITIITIFNPPQLLKFCTLESNLESNLEYPCECPCACPSGIRALAEVRQP